MKKLTKRLVFRQSFRSQLYPPQYQHWYSPRFHYGNNYVPNICSPTYWSYKSLKLRGGWLLTVDENKKNVMALMELKLKLITKWPTDFLSKWKQDCLFIGKMHTSLRFVWIISKLRPKSKVITFFAMHYLLLLVL